ncbi:MAG: hypothetical protein ACR2QW_05345 [bacterium]
MEITVSLFSALLLAAVHIWVVRFQFLDGKYGALFKSFGGGVAVGYVFVYMLPKLGKHQSYLRENIAGLEGVLANHLYLVTALGLIFYYGLMRAEVIHASPSSTLNQKAYKQFIAGLQSFGPVSYSVLIGYLLPNLPRPGVAPIILSLMVMAVHFTMLDHTLWHKHLHRYAHVTRWWLAAGLLAGWGMGVMLNLPRHVEAIWFAFLAGATIMVTLREEIPDAKQGRFLTFILGFIVLTIFGILAERVPSRY